LTVFEIAGVAEGKRRHPVGQDLRCVEGCTAAQDGQEANEDQAGIQRMFV
jgi:hypothetical protein